MLQVTLPPSPPPFLASPLCDPLNASLHSLLTLINYRLMEILANQEFLFFLFLLNSIAIPLSRLISLFVAPVVFSLINLTRIRSIVARSKSRQIEDGNSPPRRRRRRRLRYIAFKSNVRARQLQAAVNTKG